MSSPYSYTGYIINSGRKDYQWMTTLTGSDCYQNFQGYEVRHRITRSLPSVPTLGNVVRSRHAGGRVARLRIQHRWGLRLYNDGQERPIRISR
jgi:hypothetical protein